MSGLRRAGVMLICAKVVLIPLVFDPRELVVFAMPKALLSHAFAYVLLGLLVAYFARHGRRGVVWTPVHLPVLALVLIYCIATAFAVDSQLGLFGAHDRLLGLSTLLDNAVLYLAALTFVRTAREVFFVAAALLLTPLALVAYQLVQMAGLDPFPWASGFVRDRPFASMGNAGVLAQYLGTLGGAALVLACAQSGIPDRRVRLGLAVIAAIVFIGAVLTGTRAVFFGLGTAALVTAGYVIWKSRTRVLRVAVLGGVVIAAVALIGAVALTPAGRGLQSILLTPPSFTSDGTVAAEGSVSGRLVIYGVALAELQERPLLGVGPDNYVARFSRYRPGPPAGAEFNVPQTSTHSWILHVATSSGALGLAAFLAALLFAVAIALRCGMPPLAAAGAGALASFLATGLVTVNDVGTEWLFWLGLAAVASAGAAPFAVPREETKPAGKKKRARQRTARLPAWRHGLSICAVAVGGVLALTPLQAVDAAIAAETARQARARGDTRAAEAASTRAVSSDPRRAEYWNGLALSETRARDWAGAVRAFERAVAIAPYHATYRMNLARAWVAKGDPSARARGLEVAREAVEIDAYNAQAHFTLALAALASGDSRSAIAGSERGLELDPSSNDIPAHEVGVRAYLQAGSAADAERWARRGLANVSLGPTAFDLVVLLARSLFLQGRSADALAQLQTGVIDLDPKYEPALLLRKEIESAPR